MENGEEKRFLADNKSLIGLGLFVVLCLFGAICTIREFIRPSEHVSVSESLRLLGEAVESEYGILPAAEDSSALESDHIIDDRTDEQ